MVPELLQTSKNPKFIVHRREYIKFCEGEKCPALVLSVIGNIYAYQYSNLMQYLEDENLEFDPAIDGKYLHIRISMERIADLTHGLYRKETVSKGIQYLMDKGVMTCIADHKAEDSKPRTYTFNSKPVNDFIQEYDNKFKSLSSVKRRKNKASTDDTFSMPTDRKIDTLADRKIDLYNNKRSEKNKNMEVYKYTSGTTRSGTSCGSSDNDGLQRCGPLFPSKDVETLFNHWNNLSGPTLSHQAKTSSKTFNNSIHCLKKALKNHSINDITRSMDNYNSLLLDTNSIFCHFTQSNRPGLVVPLYEFFKFSNYTEERMLKNKDTQIPESWFTECLLPLDELKDKYSKYDTDDNPKVTEALIRAYKEKINGVDKLSVTDKNCFIRAARMLVQFHTKNKKNIYWMSCPSEREYISHFAHRVIDACVDCTKDINSIKPTWFCTNKMYEERLPNFLRKRGLTDPAEFKGRSQSRQRNSQDEDFTLGDVMYRDITLGDFM